MEASLSRVVIGSLRISSLSKLMVFGVDFFLECLARKEKKRYCLHGVSESPSGQRIV